ncbi:hypothetical protein HPT25_01090 [Bacillus sp. BRMEA1]|uniref:hypothetical protein n=1 Tax=Neobacillus endophyticus TaxID=2738405 RepID=UPI001565459C|nr:hypothetical protein [Neobacillus endophyticus]NRD76103.1 hypothetical protein [Neobacillus endophyticus]
MKKNRYLLCLLLCGFMLYYAVPQLSVTAGGVQGAFSITWLVFALMVIAGNLTGLLYSPKKQVRKSKSQSINKKSRSYY